MRNSLIKHTVFLTFFIGALDFFANKLYLYWTVWWYDMIMHFLAGVLVAFALALFWHYFFKIDYSQKSAIFIAIMFSLFIGLLWELYELYFELTSFSDGFVYYSDTLSDLFLDCFGTLSGIYYINKFLKKDGI